MPTWVPGPTSSRSRTWVQALCGKWMRMDVDEAVENRFIKPTSQLRMNAEEESDYDGGLVYDRI